MKIKHLKLLAMAVLILTGISYFSPGPISAQGNLSRARCYLDVRVDNNTGNVTIRGDVSERVPGRDPSNTSITLWDSELTQVVDEYGADSVNASYTSYFPNGNYMAYIDGQSSSNPNGGSSSCSDSKAFTVDVEIENPTEYCHINSFTADNSNPAYNSGTTLRYSLDMLGSFTWNISLLDGRSRPSPSSGSATSGTSTTGNLTQSHTYRLTCGSAISDWTVTPQQSTSRGTIVVKVEDNNGNPLVARWAMDATLDSNDFGDTSTGGTFSKPVNSYRPYGYPLSGYSGPTYTPSTDYVSLDPGETLTFTLVYTSLGGGAVNGSCAATHYECAAGTRANQNSGSTSWTWNCNGLNGGTNASCSEDKSASTDGEISATSCEIPVGSSTCDSLVTWTTRNLTSGATEVTKNNPSNTHVSYDTSGSNLPVTIRYGVDGQTTFFLYHSINGSPTVLAQTNAAATCSLGSIWDGTICKAIPEAMTGTLTPASSSCKIALNKSNCKINFTWNTNNPEDVSQVTRNPANTVVGVGNSGSAEFVIKYDTETFYLYNNAKELAESTVASSCTSGTEWNGVRCIEIDDGGCRNGATNPPRCTIGGGGECVNGATNPPQCTLDEGGICVNGATNPPECTIDDGGVCVNGAVNPPICTIDEEGSCLNGTFNPPLCTQTRKPTFQED